MKASKLENHVKHIDGYEGKYMVSKSGTVYSVKNSLKILIQFVTKQGFNQVTLYRQNKVERFSVSQLVAKAFLPDYPTDGTKPKLIYINGIKTDDRAENLKLKIKRPTHSSSYKGVIWSNPYQKWVAIMVIKRKKIELGTFETELEASICYEKALKKKKLQTEFKRMNKKLLENEEAQLELQH